MAEISESLLVETAAVLVSWFAMMEAHRECSEQPPLKDEQVILSFVGSGASCRVTVGDFRCLRNALREARDG